MRRLFSIFIMSALIALTFALPVKAHPGKTDSNGGHYNRSTGEYHYHHGYPAHDHYDTDGDGIADCPYHFQDKTDHDSSKTNTSKKSDSPDSIPRKKDSVKAEIEDEKTWFHKVWAFFVSIGNFIIRLMEFSMIGYFVLVILCAIVVPLIEWVKNIYQESLGRPWFRVTLWVIFWMITGCVVLYAITQT